MAKAASNVETAWRFLRGKGLSPAQAAGVIGSMQGESGQGLDPTATNPNGGAFGIAQWLGGRKSALMAQKDPSSLHTQLNHLWSELQGPESAALKALRATHTPADAAVAWQKVYERGAPFEQKYDQRAANARNVFSSLKGVGGSTALGDMLATPPGSDSSTSHEAPAVQQGDAGATSLLSALLQQSQPQAPPSSPIADPAFSARSNLKLPGGYQQAPSGGGPAPPRDLSPLIDAAAQLQGPSPAAPDTSSAPAGASPDVADPNTGPAGGQGFGKAHSPLFELIHKGDRPYAVKNGQKVDPSVYQAVWDNHAGHVHVAAGPNTIVALGKLAQQMGLSVSGNPYFTGHPETGGHAAHSYHYRTGKTKSGKIAGEAIDVGGDPRKMNLYAARVESLYGLG